MTAPTEVENLFLSGNFAPVHEEVTADNLRVTGELPAGLNGMFIRNGPNPRFSPMGRYHWFDGDGMLHGVRISNGTASYRNRWVRTAVWKADDAAGRELMPGILEMGRLPMPAGVPANKANTALVWHDGRLLALWEGGEPTHVRMPGLETAGPYDYCGALVSAFTAHPKVDEATGEMMFFGYSLFQPPYVRYSVVARDGEIVRTVPIELPVGVMMHDFAITERHTIFMDLPLTFRIERAMQGGPPLAFERDRPSRFGIMPRHGDGTGIRWFEAPACFVYHTLNAYEDGDEVVLTACRMTSAALFTDSTPAQPGTNPTADTDSSAYLHRWRFNLATGAVREEQLDDVASEFPRVNDRHLGRATRYGYAARMASDRSVAFSGLLKYDLDSGRAQAHDFGRRRYGGEGVFVPRPNATAEDDGWLLTFVYDNDTGTSELLVVEASDLSAAPVARVHLPRRVPYGFHGAWLSDDQIAAQRP